LPGGALAVPHGDEIVPLINRLLQLPFDVIVASRDLHPIKHMSFASTWEKKVGERIIVGGDEREVVEQILWPDHCVEGTQGAEFAERSTPLALDRCSTRGLTLQ